MQGDRPDLLDVAVVVIDVLASEVVAYVVVVTTVGGVKIVVALACMRMLRSLFSRGFVFSYYLYDFGLDSRGHVFSWFCFFVVCFITIFFLSFVIFF